jgi:uncharacterized protein (TIGR03435 family)
MKVRSLLVFLCLTFAVAQNGPSSFEVASVRPNRSASRNSSSRVAGEQWMFRNETLKDLIEKAYDVRDFSLSGPGWLDSVRFDVVAKFVAGSTDSDRNAMLRRLLAERFNLNTHWEKREATGFELVLAKKRRDLQKSTYEDPGTTNIGNGRIEAKNVSMATFADALATELDRPVDDQTGVKGSFDLRVLWAPEQFATGHEAALSEGPTLFSALEEQLGLRLRAKRVQIDTLIVDHAEKVPSDN